MTSLTILKQRKFGAFTFDSTLREAHRVSNTVTLQPVELGASLTDHAFSQPTEVIITAEVSDTAIRPNPSFDKGDSGARSSSAYEQVVSLIKSRELFSIQTGLTLYNNMLVTNYTTQQTAESANTCIMIINCLQIKQVSINTTDVPPEFLQQGKTADNASDTVQQGNKQSTDPTETQRGVADSTLFNLFGDT